MKSVSSLVVYLNIFGILSPSWGQSNCGDNQPDPATGLSPRQKRLLRSTWDIIVADPLAAGEAIMLEYFLRYPHHQNVFKTFTFVPYHELPENPAFQKLCTAVIDSLSSMIDSLDDPDVLVKILLTLAEDHKKLGVTKAQYIDLRESTIHVLARTLGSRWYKDVIYTWNQTLDTINSIIFKVYE